MIKPKIIWFRRDLRLLNQAAVIAAAASKGRARALAAYQEVK